jgi:NTE family protein
VNVPCGQLLTLAFLSTNPPSEAIGEALAHAIHDETGESVALVCLTASNAGSANGERQPEVMLGQPAWQQKIFKSGNGFNVVHIGVPVESIKDGAIEELTVALRRRFPWVLMTCAAPELPAGVVMDFITRSDKGFLFLQHAQDDKLRLELLMRYLRSRFNGHVHDQIKTVLCLADGQTVGDFDEQIEDAGTPVHTYLHGSPTSSATFKKDIRRMARDITGRLVGLALASGGAKGFAHIGVLQVLEENGIEVDIVAGSSMGAYVGSIWAHGTSGPEMEKLARELEGRWAIWSLIDPAFPPRRGFLRGVAVKHRLMRTIGESHFGDLLRPMRVVATNLETLERVVFTRGTVADAVHASIAVPGICVPVVVGQDTFADGGIVDPLPVDVLLDAGVRRIIAVNTIPTPERIRQAMLKQRARARENRPRRRERSNKILPFDKHLNYFARGNILEILMRSFLGVQTRMAENSALRANVVLCPEIDDNRWVDFRNPDKYIRAGRNITLKHLDEIKALVRDNGVSHEMEQVKEPMVAIG